MSLLGFTKESNHAVENITKLTSDLFCTNLRLANIVNEASCTAAKQQIASLRIDWPFRTVQPRLCIYSFFLEQEASKHKTKMTRTTAAMPHHIFGEKKSGFRCFK